MEGGRGRYGRGGEGGEGREWSKGMMDGSYGRQFCYNESECGMRQVVTNT